MAHKLILKDSKEGAAYIRKDKVVELFADRLYEMGEDAIGLQEIILDGLFGEDGWDIVVMT